MTARVAVTGGSGKLGSAVIADLLAHGWQVHNFDVAAPRQRLCSFTRVDLTDYGQAMDLATGIDELYDNLDAIVHLAAIPGATHAANAATFANNIVSTYNVFNAARVAQVRNVVWASSETLLGYPFTTTVPPYVPMDEEYAPMPNVAYSLAKDLEEELARQFCRWDPATKMVGLRFSNVIGPGEYADFPDFDADPPARKWNLWSYIDARDGAQAVRLALDYDQLGYDAFNIAAEDTVMSRSSAGLMAEYFPRVEIRAELGERQSLTSIEKAKRLLGFAPQHRWHDNLDS